MILHNILVRMRVSGELADEVDDRGRALSAEQFAAEFHDSEQAASIATQVHQDAQGAPVTGLAALVTRDEAARSRFMHSALRDSLVAHQ